MFIQPTPIVSSLQSKFLQTAASAPWPGFAGARFIAPAMRDLDGDGRDEVIALCPGSQQLLQNGSLGVLSYFDYGAMTPAWSSAAAPQLVATAMLSNQFSPGLVLPSSFVQARMRPDAPADILQFDGITPKLAVYSWNWGSKGLAPLWTSPTDGLIEGANGPISFDLSGGQFCVGDFDGDGLDEIYGLNSQSLALLKWNVDAKAIELVWQSGASIMTGRGIQWFVGDVDGDGRAELISYDADRLVLFVEKFVSGDFVLLSDQQGSIPFEGGGRPWTLPPDALLRVADVDGDGVDELVAYYEIEGVVEMSVLRWSQGAGGFAVSGPGANAASRAGDAPLRFSASAGDPFYVARFEQEDRAAILMHLPAAIADWNIAILRWSEADRDFVVDYTNRGTDFSLTGPNGQQWTFGDDNRFTFADVDGDGIKEIIVQSDSANGLALVKWNAGQLDLEWAFYYGAAASGQAQLPGWSIGIIAGAPQTGYTPFTGAQGDIYANTSSSLQLSTADIRSLYPNMDLNADFPILATQLKNALSGLRSEPPVYPWDWAKNYAASDLAAVWGILNSELNGVGLLYTFRGNVAVFLNQIVARQNTDLNTAVGNFNSPPAGGNPVVYWLSQLFDAAIWGIAAAPIGPEGQVVFAVVASLFGSLLNAPGNNSSITVSYTELEGEISNNYLSAMSQVDGMIQGPAGLIFDTQKLTFLATLLANPWPWNGDATDQVVAATSPFNRLYFYQTLMGTSDPNMPSLYKIYAWKGWLGAQPYFYINEGKFDNRYDVSAPPYAIWTYPTQIPDEYDIYVLCTSDSNYQKMTYPPQALTADLFTTAPPAGIGANVNDFLNGTNGWNLTIEAGGEVDPN